MSSSSVGIDPHLLAEVAAALLDAGAADSVSRALVRGELTATSTSVRRSALAAGSRLVEARLGDLQELWRKRPDVSPQWLALAMQAAVEALRAERMRAARTEVVWTGPRAETSYLRATRQVVLDLVQGADAEVLVVGYWIAPGVDPAGIVPQIIDAVATAARRGARVKVVLDQTARLGGASNRDLFLTLWPSDVPVPLLLTWRAPGDNEYLKLHAKVIVADHRDALVTSANLTMHAMDLNMEMGVRVLGAPAASIADHFDLLIAKGTLQPYNGNA